MPTERRCGTTTPWAPKAAAEQQLGGLLGPLPGPGTVRALPRLRRRAPLGGVPRAHLGRRGGPAAGEGPPALAARPAGGTLLPGSARAAAPLAVAGHQSFSSQ